MPLAFWIAGYSYFPWVERTVTISVMPLAFWIAGYSCFPWVETHGYNVGHGYRILIRIYYRRKLVMKIFPITMLYATNAVGMTDIIAAEFIPWVVI